jgi:hypothetical protein
MRPRRVDSGVGVGESYMLRFGKFVPTDEVRDAWVSGDLDRM